jgi:hypothetical protein
MFKTLAIAALSVAALAHYPTYYPNNQYGVGNTVNRLNNVENRKLVNIHNAVDRNVGYGNYGLNRQLKNELTGIVTQGTDQLNSLAINGGSSFGCY